jgi:hypothetical protein
MDLLTLSNVALAAIPATVGLSAIARNIGLSDRYSPIADIVFGIALIALIGGVVWQAVILQGILVGLSAAGLYNAPQIVAGKVGKIPQG